MVGGAICKMKNRIVSEMINSARVVTINIVRRVIPAEWEFSKLWIAEWEFSKLWMTEINVQSSEECWKCFWEVHKTKSETLVECSFISWQDAKLKLPFLFWYIYWRKKYCTFSCMPRSVKTWGLRKAGMEIWLVNVVSSI